jgi:hypothetical protein
MLCKKLLKHLKSSRAERVLRLEVSVRISSSSFLKPKGRGYGFLSGFPPLSFSVYSN